MENLDETAENPEHSTAREDRPGAADEQARLPDALFASIIESDSRAIISKTLDGKITSWNKSAQRLFGYAPEEIIGKNISVIFPLERLKEQAEILEKIERGEEIKNYKTIRKRKDGVFIPVEISISPIRNSKNEIVGASKIARAIPADEKTGNNRSEEQIFSEAVINSLPGIFYLFDADGKFLRWNENFERVSGYDAEEIGQMRPPDFFSDKSKRLVEERFNEIFIIGESSVKADLAAKNGKKTPYYLTGKKINLDGTICLMGTGVDISERILTERALRQSEERYRAFIEHSKEGIWRFDINEPIRTNLPVEEQIELLYQNSRLAECNDVKARQYGLSKASELLGNKLSDFLVRSDRANQLYLQNFIQSRYYLIDNETHEKDRNGDDKYFLSSLVGIVENGFLISVWGVQRDITEIKQARKIYLESEEQLRHSQKVEAIGRLAGGIAHDFNNFLAVIMLHVDMLNLQLPADSPLRFRLEEMKSVTNKAAAMVRQLLAFGRKQTLQPAPVVMNQVVREFVKILRPLIGEDIEINIDLDPQLGVCFLDPDQMTQVLMNLAVNARDAMPDGGTLKIETSNIFIDKQRLRVQSQPIGEYVQITVSDSGVGMSDETKKRIFEPFFTTKAPNKGTGLGLATVYGIIKQSNGFIWTDSKINKGTTFHVQFPRIDQPAETLIKEEGTAMPTGSETILLVEDEDPVRRAAVEVLNILGYQVFEAGNGEQAVQIAHVLKKPIHLLLTDVIMPQMNGREVAEAIKTIHPETLVLFMSGYSDDIISDHGILDKNVHFLEKPFTPLTLAKKVRQVLDKLIEEN